MSAEITIRKADATDFDHVFALGSATPEFQTSGQEPFMDRDELLYRLKSETSLFLLAESGDTLAGFAYSETVNTDAPIKHKFACLVYIVVAEQFRSQGIAQKLLEESESQLRSKGFAYVYVWANQEGDGAIERLLTKAGYVPGHVYRWMDKKL